jgi:hypothetical protein
LSPADGSWEIDHGRDYIDIRLRHIDTRDRVIIETKWNAGDRPGQVFDYWRSERKRTGRWRIPVVYLTPTGRTPDLGLDAADHDKFRRDLVQMSYRTDLASMLSNCLINVAAPRVRETLDQYIELLKSLPSPDEGNLA